MFTAVEAERASGSAAHWYLAAAVVSASAGVAVESAYSHAHRAAAASARAALTSDVIQMRVALGYVMTGLLTAVGDIVAEKNQRTREKLQAALSQAVVDSAAVLVGCDRVRATFYRAQGHTPDGRIAELELVVAAGVREQRPRRHFRRGDGSRGDAVLAIVEQRDFDFIPDVQQRHDSRYWAGKDYRVLACVSVVAGDTPYGILAIDAPDPNDLNDDCLPVLRALATLLGAGLAR